MGFGGFKYRNITTATTTAIKSGKGRLSHISINGSSLAGAVTVYDNTSAAGTKIATIASGASGGKVFDVALEVGLTVVTASADDITVVYE